MLFLRFLMREFFFFFPSNFFHFPSSVSAESVCSFFFQTKSSFRKKDTKEREIPLLSLFSLLSQKSLSLSFSLSSVVKFLFDERERERKKCARPFLVFASFLREYIRERERKRNCDSIDSGLKRNVFIFIFIIFERAIYIQK